MKLLEGSNFLKVFEREQLFISKKTRKHSNEIHSIKILRSELSADIHKIFRRKPSPEPEKLYKKG